MIETRGRRSEVRTAEPQNPGRLWRRHRRINLRGRRSEVRIRGRNIRRVQFWNKEEKREVTRLRYNFRLRSKYAATSRRDKTVGLGHRRGRG
jgi:hypothetical protein